MSGMPRVSRLIMFSCGEEGVDVAEHFIDYVSDTLGGEVRLAPVEMCHEFGTRIGVILVTGVPRSSGGRRAGAEHAVEARALAAEQEDEIQGSPGADETNAMFHSKSVDEDAEIEGPPSPVSSPVGRKQPSNDGDVKSIGGSEASNSFGGESDDGFDDKLDDDESAIERLLREKYELEQELIHARQLNQEIQKKAANVLARSNKDAGGGARGGGDEAMDAGATAATNSDSLAEKERHYKETMELIQECQTRLKKEQTEYEQQALDLQTRLDDKEFKAEEIAASLRQFKREILTKAENSRTGKGVSQRLIKQFEQAEMKKDEDLEKVIIEQYLDTLKMQC